MGKLFGTAAFAAMMFATASAMAGDASTAARGVIEGQIEAFGSGQHEKAFGYAAPTIRSMFKDTASFVEMVKRGYGPIYGARSFAFGRMKGGGDGPIYQEVLIQGPNGRSWVALYTLLRGADGDWKIGGVRLVPGSEQTT